MEKKGIRTFNKVISAILIIVMCLAFMPNLVMAEDLPENENSVTASLADDGTLTVSGEGILTQKLVRKYDYANAIKKVVINTGITKIDNCAFDGCNELENVEINANITEIGGWAFYGCKKLASINLPDSITVIQPFAFDGCESLVSITLPSSLQTLERYAFSNCKKLTTVNFPNNLEFIGRCAFNNCEQLESVVLPESITFIGKKAFYKCTGLNNFYLPSSVANVNNDILAEAEIRTYIDNENVKEVDLPDVFKRMLDKDDKMYLGTIEVGGYTPEPILINCTLNEDKTKVLLDVTKQRGCALVSLIGKSNVVEDNFRINYIISLSEMDISSNGDESVIASIVDKNTVNVNGTGNIKSSYTFKEGDSVLGDSLGFDYYGDIKVFDNTEKVGQRYYNTENDAQRYFGDLNRIINLRNVKNINFSNGLLDADCSGCINLESVTIPESVTTVKCDGCISLTNIQLPSGLENISFENCLNLENVELPDEIEYIPSYAFKNCKNLTMLNIPDGIKSIQNNLFQTGLKKDALEGCDKLTTINIPSSLTEYEGTLNIKSLKNINVDSNNTKFSSIDGVLFNKEGTVLLDYPKGREDENYTVPNGVTEISASAFENCTNLKSITMPSSLTKIGDKAFKGCKELTDVVMQNGVTEIGEYAFKDCRELINIELPSSLKTIKREAFSRCYKLENINIPENMLEIEADAFDYCISLNNISMPQNISNMGKSVFTNCIIRNYQSDKNVTQIDMPEILRRTLDSEDILYSDGSKTIGHETHGFKNCSFSDDKTKIILDINNKIDGYAEIQVYSGPLADLSYRIYLDELDISENQDDSIVAKLTSPDTLTITGTGKIKEIRKVDYYVSYITEPENISNVSRFYDIFPITRIKNVIIEDGITNISKEMFVGFNNLENISIPNTITEIGEKAFYACSNLKKIELTENGTKIGENKLPSSLTTIGKNAFDTCKSLSSIEISESLKIINNYAFVRCNGLKNVKISNGVTKIYEGAFAGCSGLTEIEIPDSVTFIDDYVFKKCSGLNKVDIPQNISHISEETFAYCTGLTEVDIPNNITEIGENAFLECTNLKKVTIKDNNRIGVNVNAFDKIIDGCNDQVTLYFINSQYIPKLESQEAYAYHLENKWATKFVVETEDEEPLEQKMGDVSGNGEIDPNDYIAILRHIAAQTDPTKQKWILSEEKQAIADVTKDGKIDLNDVIKIKRYIAAKNDSNVANAHPNWLNL